MHLPIFVFLCIFLQPSWTEALICKYSEAESNVMELKITGATVLHGVNAKKMKSHTYLKTRQFDRIVFNFPHAGFKAKDYKEVQMVRYVHSLPMLHLYVAGFISG